MATPFDPDESKHDITIVENKISTYLGPLSVQQRPTKSHINFSAALNSYFNAF
jgi:hypothetical protein